MLLTARFSTMRRSALVMSSMTMRTMRPRRLSTNSPSQQQQHDDEDSRRREGFLKRSVEQQQLTSFDPEDQNDNSNNDSNERAQRVKSAVRVTLGIIAINAIVNSLSSDPDYREFIATHCICSYDQVINKGRWYTMLTSAFTHISFWHFLANSLAILSFSPPLIQLLGARSFLRWYFTAAVVSSGAFVAQRAALMSREPSREKRQELSENALVGASGAVMQSVSMFALRYPRSRLLLLFVIPVPTFLAVAGLLFYDFMMLDSSDHIAHISHLAGAGVGVVAFFVERRLRPQLFLRPRQR